MYEIGAAKVDITAYEDGMPMFGWVYPDNVVKGVAMPLYARAFVLDARPEQGKLAFALLDYGYISQALRQAVLDKLTQDHPERGFGEHNVMLAATHTHSAPGGLSHYLFYCAASSGFSQPVFDTVVDGVVAAIVEADARRKPGTVRLERGAIPESERIAFNRNIHAYNANEDVSPKLAGKRSARAVDRDMTLLRFDDARGKAIGALCWFGVHGTSVHRDNQLLHPDHKGIAAELLEQRLGGESGNADFVAGFAQGPCGDVTPNYRYDRRRGFMIGEHDDDFESARFNAEIQARHAAQLFASAAKEAPLQKSLDASVLYADLGDVEVAPIFAGGLLGQRTSPSSIGLRMIFGTEEGPGLPYSLTDGLERLTRLWGKARQAAGRLGQASRSAAGRDQRSQAPKLSLIDTGRGPDARFFGLRSAARPPPLPGALHPVIAFMRRALPLGALDSHPLTPRVLPVQVFTLGRLAIAALPGEPTTISGRRLRQSLGAALVKRGVTQVVVSPYANAYAGYVTTAEEYALQSYEGASTHFGRWTLAAYQTLFNRLAKRLLLKPEQRPEDIGPPRPRFTPEVMAARAFRAP